MSEPENPLRVALFCGSAGWSAAGRLGANAAALHAVRDAFAAQGANCVDAADVADVPAFRAEDVDSAPRAVAELRSLFESVDAVVLATPEFGGGAAGAAKNALDWMVGSGSLYRRPCGVISAGTTGGSNSIEQIVRTLTWQGAFVIATVGIATPGAKRDAAGRFLHEPTLNRLASMAVELRRCQAMADEAITARAAEVVRALGIDPLRRSGR